jgi:hypothetical protein
MKKLNCLLLVLCLSLPVLAQNIGADLQRMLDKAPLALATGTAEDNPALDTIVLTLAYYGGMPNDDRVTELLSGPELLSHYSGNSAIREFLLNEKLDRLLEEYIPDEELAVPAFMAAPSREAFLRSLAGSELFSRDGKVDLGKIRDVFTSPPSVDFNLKAAANGAASQAEGLPTASLISNAISGLSDWISRRAQEELTYTFLTKLEEDIQKNDLQFLFPQTSEFLPTLDLLNYKAILPSIRKAFTEDLNAIAFNLGEYLEAQDAVSYRDPVTYNVFLIYRILDLEMREVPLADILSFTYAELEKARIDTRCQIDLGMAKADTSNVAYTDILVAFDQYIAANQNLNQQFKRANDLLSAQFFNPILDAVEANDFASERGDEFIQRAAGLFLPLDAEKLPLQNNYWQTTNDPPATGIVKAWLRGNEAYEYYEAYPSLTRFDELFGPEAAAFDPQERRAAGLTAVREILAQRSNLGAYNEQLDRLIDTRKRLINLRQEISSQRLADSLSLVSVSDQHKELLADIDAEMAAVRPDQQPALRLLRKVTESILPEEKSAGKQLLATRQRLANWVTNQGSSTSPFALKMRIGPVEAASLPPLQRAIDATDVAYDNLTAAVSLYSRNQADSLIRAYQNLTTFETVFGMAQQTFFLLSESNSDLFLDKRKMAVFQTNPSARKLLSGITHERIGRVPNLGKLNSDGLTDFLLDFSLYLSDFRSAGYSKEMEGLTPQQVKRIQAVSFIANTMQSLLEAPVLQNPSDETTALSLIDRYPAFSKVPEVSQELNELFRLTTKGEYRYAVDNLLNLLRLFDVIPTASKKQHRLTKRRDKLKGILTDYVVEQDADLKAVGLAAPSAANLQLDIQLDKNDVLKIQTYNRNLSAAVSNFEREDATNSLLDLKMQRVREELQFVEKRLGKLNPERTNRFRESLFRYGTFMADVAAAENSTDFEAALNTMALPAGSSQIKRSRPSSFELGAYFGAALSQERLVLPTGIDAPELEEEVFGAALFVPVGISYSRNIGGGKSITFFGSLIDLGAITAFRLGNKNDDVDAASVDRLPEFRPANIIAPGFHLMYNFPKSPFTLGVGIQDGPSVRKFTLQGQTLEREARSVRGMVTFSVDVPIFRFFNK